MREKPHNNGAHHMQNVSILRRVHITESEATAILGAYKPTGIDQLDAKNSFPPELYNALLRERFFRKLEWNPGIWIRTEFVVCESVPEERVEKADQPIHPAVSTAWWIDNLTAQLATNQELLIELQEAAEATAARRAELEDGTHRSRSNDTARQHARLNHIFDLTIEEATRLQKLLAALIKNPLPIQAAQEQYGDTLVQSLLEVKILQLAPEHDTVTANFDELRHRKFFVSESSDASAPVYITTGRSSKTGKPWAHRLSITINHARNKEAKRKNPDLASTETIKLTYFFNLTREEATQLRDLLAELKKRPLSIQDVKTLCSDQLAEDLLDAQVLRLTPSAAEITVDFDKIRRSGFSITQSKSPDTPLFLAAEGQGSTAKPWEQRLSAVIDKSLCKASTTKKATPPKKEKFNLDWELALTTEEADQLHNVAGGAVHSEFSERFLYHLIHYGYLIPQQNNRFELKIDLLNHTSFRVLDPDDLLSMRLSANVTGSMPPTRADWTKRLTKAIRKAAKRHSQITKQEPRMVSVERRFTLTRDEGARLLTILAQAPFLPGEMFGVLGDELSQALYRFRYLLTSFGRINTGNFVTTEFTIVESLDPACRYSILPENKRRVQSDTFWLEKLLEQIGDTEAHGICERSSKTIELSNPIAA